jgi:PadR family transcriptional regulator PadR
MLTHGAYYCVFDNTSGAARRNTLEGNHLEEISAADKKFQKELSAGTVALVLLSVLDGAGGPMYGYQIAKLLEAGREGVDVPITKKHGALYPVLRSLENSGLLESRVEPSVSGPPRRYYTITPAGRDALARWVTIWEQTRRFIDDTLKGPQQ